MRRVVALVGLLMTVAVSCSVDAGEMAAGDDVDSDNRITFDELTEAVLDPASDVDLDQVDGIDLEDIAPTSTTFCEAFAAVPMTWVDDAVVPIQMFVDAWTPVDDAPDAVAADVDAVLAFGERKLDWNFGRLDRDARPTADAAFMDRLERIADAAVEQCDALPLRIGQPEDWAVERGWEPEEVDRRCAGSLETAEEGLPLYRELRGGEPGHAMQIELAALADWYRSFETGTEGPQLWFVPELHGLDTSSGSVEIVAMEPCDDT